MPDIKEDKGRHYLVTHLILPLLVMLITAIVSYFLIPSINNRSARERERRMQRTNAVIEMTNYHENI